jgi:RNA polymerase sigma-70 factor, ECF subfamily
MNRGSGGTDRRRRFEALAAAFAPDLKRFAFWLARDRQLAEDVVQEALLRAWKSFDALDDDTRAKPWLLTIVRREFARHFERRRHPTVDLDALVVAESDALAVDDDAGLAELRAAIFRLEHDYREPLVMQVLLGHSTAEIAAELGLTQGAVLTRLFRARQRLRRIMGVDIGADGDTLLAEDGA